MPSAALVRVVNAKVSLEYIDTSGRMHVMQLKSWPADKVFFPAKDVLVKITKEAHGTPHYPPGIGKILVKLLFGRVWRETGLPKGLLGTIQSKHLAQIPRKPHGRPFPPQNNVFRAPAF